jgi:glycosyltransferase involved in cell wall biosynthesis
MKPGSAGVTSHRVFIVSYLYDPSITAGMGGFRKVAELARQFGRRHKVTLFLPAYSRHATELDCVWVPVINTAALRVVSFNLFLIPAVLWRSSRGRPRVLYQRVFTAVTAPWLAGLLGCRYVIEFNGNPLQFYARTAAFRLVRALTRWSLLRADRIICLTEGLKSELSSDFGVDVSNVSIVPSGSDPRLFFPRSRAECRNRLRIDPERPMAAFAGTFFAYQGIDLLLQALTDSRLRDLEVWLLGDGAMRRAWENRAAELGLGSIRFTGQVDYSEVPWYLGAADFCLAPFDPDRGEVSPLKVIDYLFCGRPTVIARIPAVEDLLRKFPSLLAFTAGSPESLADALVKMIAESGVFLTQATSDSIVAREEYSWDAIARRIEAESF